MAKPKRQYECSACGILTPQWAGQCGDCGAWNSLQETVIERHHPGNTSRTATNFQVTRLAEVSTEAHARIVTGIGELDRVLGGGLVSGSVILLGGDPGIGKSTLLLQTLSQLATQHHCLYISGEESTQQVSLRASRLGLPVTDLQIATETCIERMLAGVAKIQPTVMVVDSIQTLFSEALQSVPGSVAQVRESAAQLVRYAKQHDTVVIIIGHVTKEGNLAGPRILEHMVDTVLYFEGDAGNRYRVIRAVKNRFGAVNELGVFAMLEHGLKPVSNPSAIFISRHEQPVPGSIIMVTREGTRPLLVEVQALADNSHLGNPRRVAIGFEQNRLAMLLAVLHRHGGIAMYDQDVFVNVVGGVRVSETAADVAVIMACLSSFKNKPLPNTLIAFGEIGLAGEIRPVPNGEERLLEAAKHGFAQALLPAANIPKNAARHRTLKNIDLIAAQRISDIIDLC